MAAAVGVSPNVIYAAGLYGPFGPANFTISSSGTSVGGSTVTINYTWIGYLRPSVSGTNLMTINSVWDQFASFDGTTYNIDWGGSPSSVSYLWVGANAISGFTTGNTNATSNNGSATYSPTLTAGINYPVRYNWQASLSYSSNVFGGYPGWTTGNCSFSVNNGSGFYNSTSNGF